MPEYPSGQRGLTVNQLAYAFEGSNPSSGTIWLSECNELSQMGCNKQSLPFASQNVGANRHHVLVEL